MSATQKPLEVLIVGTGAVGSIFGARAQTSRSRVTTICRSNYDAVKSRGISIRSALWGNSIFKPDRVARAPSEVSHVDFDYVVLATKLTNAPHDPLIDSIRAAVRAKTVLVSVQNGVTSENALRRAFDNNPIFSSTCYISCAQRAPGIVEQISHVRPHAFYVGVNRAGRSSDGKAELNRLVTLDNAFAQVADAHGERWRKMIFNTAWSLSTSLMDRNTHEVLRDPEGAQLVLGLAQEAHRVARAVGVDVASDIPKYTVESASKADPIVPSMLQDIRAGRPIEVEALCGGILRVAQENGVETPLLSSMYHFLTQLNTRLEAARRKPVPAVAMAEMRHTLEIPTPALGAAVSAML